MMQRKSRRRVYWPAAAMFAFLGVLLFTDFGIGKSLFIEELLNFGHLPLFGVVALAILWMIRSGEFPGTNVKAYVKAGVLTMGIGFITEILQFFTPGRFFQISDLVYDFLGILTFLILVNPFPGRTGQIRNTVRGIAIGLIALAAVPIGPAGMDTWAMKREFPLISSFESPLEMMRWKEGESVIMRVNSHSSDGDYALKVKLMPGTYPGISLSYLVGDWEGYETLAFDVFLEGDTVLTMTVRVNDLEHNEEYTDRFNRGFSLIPGQNQVTIDLNEVKNAPKGREMDMMKIVNICIFAYKLEVERTVYFDYFRLEK